MARADAFGVPLVGRREEEAGRRQATTPDWGLIAGVLGLTTVGLIFVFSASFAVGQRLYGDPEFFATRQIAAAAIGLIGFVVLARMDYRRLRGLSPLILLVTVLGLVAVLAPGVGFEQNGATRWIQIGALPALQPSEFAKLGMIIYVAAWLASRREAIQHISLGVVPFAVMVGFFGFLIMAQPDLGTSLVLMLAAVAMLFTAGAALRHMAALGLIGSGVLFGIIYVFGYGLDRFTQFVSAESNPEAGGFQILQLAIALGSGGITGVGLGESRQKFFFVPSAHTDGVYAIVGEELGFIGAMAVLLIFLYVAYRGIRITMKAPDTFGALLGVGIVSWLMLQMCFNIGGITRTIPMTGIPLPFISFGGSALIASLAAAGVLVSISRFTLDGEDPDTQRGGGRRRDYARRIAGRGKSPG